MLAGMSPNAADRMIEQIRVDDPALADWLATQRISFNQVLTLPQAQLALLIAQLGDSDLLLALRGLSTVNKQVLLSGLSKRRGQMLWEELQAMAPVPKRAVEDALARIVAMARDLEAKGQISFSDGPMLD